MNDKIIISFSDKPVIKGEKSIFLAGPTRRNSSFNASWRKEACNLLSSLGFEGIIYVPEYSPDADSFVATDEDVKRQTYWEWEALDSAAAIVFWVDRKLEDMPAFTTNVEMGIYFTKSPEKCFLGYPESACKMRYPELLYRERMNRASVENLAELLSLAVKYVNEK